MYERTIYYSYIDRKWKSYYVNKQGKIKQEKSFRTKNEAKNYYKEHYKNPLLHLTKKTDSKQYMRIELEAQKQQAIDRALRKIGKGEKITAQEAKMLKKEKKYRRDEIQKLFERKKIKATTFVSKKVHGVFQNKTSTNVWLNKDDFNELAKRIETKIKQGYTVCSVLCQNKDIGDVSFDANNDIIHKPYMEMMLNYEYSIVVDTVNWTTTDFLIIVGFI